MELVVDERRTRKTTLASLKFELEGADGPVRGRALTRKLPRPRAQRFKGRSTGTLLSLAEFGYVLLGIAESAQSISFQSQLCDGTAVGTMPDRSFPLA